MSVIDGGPNSRQRPVMPDPAQFETIPKPDGLSEDTAAVVDEL